MATETMFPIYEFNDVDLAFGPRNIKDIMPKWDDIPKQFKGFNTNEKWCKFVSDCFFSGVTDIKAEPKAGVDEKKAMRHFRAILRSWDPKHEHKEAACAYLLSQWFTDIKWKKADKK